MSTEVEYSNNDKEKERDRIDWRRSKVQELSSQGQSQHEIAQILQVSNRTVNKDLLLSGLRAKIIKLKSKFKRFTIKRIKVDKKYDATIDQEHFSPTKE